MPQLVDLSSFPAARILYVFSEGQGTLLYGNVLRLFHKSKDAEVRAGCRGLAASLARPPAPPPPSPSRTPSRPCTRPQPPTGLAHPSPAQVLVVVESGGLSGEAYTEHIHDNGGGHVRIFSRIAVSMSGSKCVLWST